jgi:hypothetical protein
MEGGDASIDRHTQNIMRHEEVDRHMQEHNERRRGRRQARETQACLLSVIAITLSFL